MTSNNTSETSGFPSPQPLINANQRRRAATGVPDAELLQAVLDRAGITSWDVLLVGDGSGTGWQDACGWAAVLIDRESRGRRLFHGAMNVGSVNFAETMPYLQAINWYDQVGGGKDRLKQQGFIRVHIITDSQVIANWGTRAASSGDLPRKHIMLWAGVRELRRLGYQFYFHWANRSTTLLNWTADLIAGLSRREILQLAGSEHDTDLATRAARALENVRFDDPSTGQAISLYHLNQDE